MCQVTGHRNCAAETISHSGDNTHTSIYCWHGVAQSKSHSVSSMSRNNVHIMSSKSTTLRCFSSVNTHGSCNAKSRGVCWFSTSQMFSCQIGQTSALRSFGTVSFLLMLANSEAVNPNAAVIKLRTKPYDSIFKLVQTRENIIIRST